MAKMEESITEIVRGLSNVKLSIRHKSFELLNALPHDAALSSLVDIATHNADYLQRSGAMEAVLIMDKVYGLNLLVRLLSDSDEHIRYHAAGLLGDYGNTEVAKTLWDYAQSDPVPDVRYVIVWTLGKIGGKDTIPILQQIQSTDIDTNFEGDEISRAARNAIELILSRPE